MSILTWEPPYYAYFPAYVEAFKVVEQTARRDDIEFPGANGQCIGLGRVDREYAVRKP